LVIKGEVEKLQAAAAENFTMGPAKHSAEARGRDASWGCGLHVNMEHSRFEH